MALRIYSKKSDHAGLFRGKASALPRISQFAPGTTGMKNKAHNNATITVE